MIFTIGQSVKIIGPAQDGNKSRIGQVGNVLHGVHTGTTVNGIKCKTDHVVIMFGKQAQVFSENAVEVMK